MSDDTGMRESRASTPEVPPANETDLSGRRRRELPGSALVSGLVGAFIEAWAELRIHRTRVLLSLIGVAVAVAALTSVVGLGAIAQQAVIEASERSSGRPATIFLNAYSTGTTQIDREDLVDAFAVATERYSIEYASQLIYTSQRIQFVDGATDVETRLVDVPYGTMHRIPMIEGQWFSDTDAERLAPAIVVNESVYLRLGSPDLASHPTMKLLAGGTTVTAVIVGVAEAAQYEQDYEFIYMLPSAYAQIADPTTLQYLAPSLEVWVPLDIADQLMELLKRDIAGALGDDVQVDAFRQDYASFGEDPFASTRLVIGGTAILVLLLGALGLVNISLVTVRQRVREIGIRRSFGATAGRVFFAVMMESVVATVAAGAVGVALAVFIVENPTVQGLVAFGIEDLPPFPASAAVLGMAAAVGVGALAGLLPALVAVRVKVIDAIRF